MRIGIDARVLGRAITGTGRYLLNFLNELPNQDSINEYVLFVTKEFSVDKKFFRVVSINEPNFPEKFYSPIWLNKILPGQVKEHKIDLLFSPNILVPLINLHKTKIVSVVHDVIPKVYKEYYPFFYRLYLSLFLPPSLRKSDLIITVSELSKNDIHRFYKTPLEKIEVVYNTASKTFHLKEQHETDILALKKRYKLPGKFLLYVGVVEKRKNVLGLIKILDRIREKGSELKLVIVGKQGYDFETIYKEIEKRKDYILYFRYLEDNELACMYNLAFAFIFPSYYEGFGIPPLEAMQSGIPVLSSNTSSLIEVVGEGGILHHPENYDGFAESVIELEDDSKFYEQLKKRALEQSKKFNITATTRKLVEIFNKL